MSKPFWETEQDLTDSEQEQYNPDTDFEADNPDGAAKSIEAAAELDFSAQTEDLIERRAREIQQTNDDPDIPNRYEDDVYTSQERAENAIAAVMMRGWGAGQGSRGVESNFQWGVARADEFGGWVKEGEPDDSDYTQDADLLPFGHPDRTIEDPPEGLSETPFVEGEPSEEKKEKLAQLFAERL